MPKGPGTILENHLHSANIIDKERTRCDVRMQKE